MLAVRAVGTIVSGASRVGRNATCLQGRDTRHPRPPFDSAHTLRMPSLDLRSRHFLHFDGMARVWRENGAGARDRNLVDADRRKHAVRLIGENHESRRNESRRKNGCR